MSAFRGVGIISIAPYDSGTSFAERAFVDTGNNSQLQDAFSEQNEEQKNYRTLAGGVYASDKRIDSFSLSLTQLDFSAENKARALWGTTSVDSGGAVTDEPHDFHFGKVIVLDKMCDDTQPVTINIGATTVNTADYTVVGSTVYVAAAPQTSGISDGDACLVDYTAVASDLIQVLTTSSPVVSVMFNGWNAITGKRSQRRYWKCRVGAAQGVDAISDSFASLPLTLTVEQDDTVVGTGLSKYGIFLDER